MKAADEIKCFPGLKKGRKHAWQMWKINRHLWCFWIEEKGQISRKKTRVGWKECVSAVNTGVDEQMCRYMIRQKTPEVDLSAFLSLMCKFGVEWSHRSGLLHLVWSFLDMYFNYKHFNVCEKCPGCHSYLLLIPAWAALSFVSIHAFSKKLISWEDSVTTCSNTPSRVHDVQNW